MTAYNHRVNHHHRTRHARRAHRALFYILALLIISGTAVGVYFWQQTKLQPAAVELKPRSAGRYYGTAKKQYTNEIFSFTSQQDWQLSQENSNIPTRYVFQSQRDGLLVYELKIYIDNPPKDLTVTHVMPVTVIAGMINATDTSNYCAADKKNMQNQSAFTYIYKGVTVTCDPHPSKELYAAGVVGGSYSIPLYNSKGELHQVVMTFVNHKTRQDASVFIEVAENFKLR